MAKEMTPGDIVQRGEKAKQLLNDPIFKEAFEYVQAEYVAQLRKCAPADDLGRYRYAEAINVVDKVKNHLKTAIVQGELTAKQSQEFRRPASLKERVIRTF